MLEPHRKVGVITGQSVQLSSERSFEATRGRACRRCSRLASTRGHGHMDLPLEGEGSLTWIRGPKGGTGEAQGQIDVGSVGAKPKMNAYHTRQLKTSTINIFSTRHISFVHPFTTTCFRWVKGNLFLRVPNGLLSILHQQCPLRIQQCILISRLAASEGSWPTSRKPEMLSSPSIPKHR